jgi:hypothetical protein
MSINPTVTRLSSPVYMQAIYEVGDLALLHSLETHTRQPRLEQIVQVFDHLRHFVQYAELVAPPTTIALPGEPALQPSWTGVSAGLRGRGSVLSEVQVITLRMESPLEVLLEIPAEVWLVSGFGLVALAERLATAPVRIARKRKEEILKSIALDHEIETIARARADTLAEALQKRQLKGDTPPPKFWFGGYDDIEAGGNSGDAPTS